MRQSIKKAKSVHIGKSPYQDLFNKYTDCTICLDPLVHKQKVKIMPICKHIFHEKCCNQWLDYRFRCPNCNSAILDSSQVPQRLQDDINDEDAWIRELEDEMRQEEEFLARMEQRRFEGDIEEGKSEEYYDRLFAQQSQNSSEEQSYALNGSFESDRDIVNPYVDNSSENSGNERSSSYDEDDGSQSTDH